MDLLVFCFCFVFYLDITANQIWLNNTNKHFQLELEWQ